jgi:hypothetical protein
MHRKRIAGKIVVDKRIAHGDKGARGGAVSS